MIVKAFRNLVGQDVKLELHGSTYEDVIWNDPRPMPSKEVWQVEHDRLMAEEPMRLLRSERNQRLANTDWWVLPDRTPTQDQLDYRQSLRDITDTYSSLDDVVWPGKP